mmetsp:Transcript_20551/g.29815  ORF Transcript_20551/g.29815 Transcript_20551/m.29815 type:complete len:223 (+) Transcript_20551:107-775(+)
MKNIPCLLLVNILTKNIIFTDAFQVRARPRLPLIPKRLGPDKIQERVDVAESSYGLHDEHELRCPMTGYSEGFLCTIDPGTLMMHETDAIENSIAIRQAAIAGSVAAAQRNPALGKSCYHTMEAAMERSQLPVELPQSCMKNAKLDGMWMLYAINSSMEDCEAECDVYIITPKEIEEVWRITVTYKAFFNKPYLRVTKDGNMVQVTKENTYDDLYSVLVGWQ